MTTAWALFILFLIGYAAMSGAALWHLNTYAFSGSGRTVAVLFTAAALSLGILSIIFFSQINWQELGSLVQIVPSPI